MSSEPILQNAIPPELVKELSDTIKGHVYPRGDSNFSEYVAMFNGNVQSPAKAVTCPLDAQDVSKIVVFCHKHSFSLSVKAGGFGTAGWAVGGDIVIDLSRLVELDIELPREDGSYTGLRSMPTSNSKGKRPMTDSDTTPASRLPGKRRREEDGELRKYDSDSPSAAAFLNGDDSPHVVRRRITETTYVVGSSSYTSDGNAVGDTTRPSLGNGSGNGSTSLTPVGIGNGHGNSNGNGNGNGHSASSSASTSRTNSDSEPSSHTLRTSHKTHSSGAPLNADPFGYLDGTTKDIPTIQSNFARPGAFNPAPQGAAPSTIVPNPSLPSTSRSMPSQSRALHPHAYVTFGAGKRQKEIDIFTSRNPLPGRSILGEEDRIPYHIPSAAHPVGSAIMLLGGFGFLSRLRGLSIDNLVEAEVVLADGRVVIVNENEHPGQSNAINSLSCLILTISVAISDALRPIPTDLFWALRGAGPAFGIATRYKVKAYPVPVVFAELGPSALVLTVEHPSFLSSRFHKSTASSLIKHFRDCVKGAPRELYANVFLTAGPPGKDSLVVIQMCYVGPKEKGQEYLLALASWEGDKNLLNDVHEKSYLHQQDSVAQVLRGKAGRQWFIRCVQPTPFCLEAKSHDHVSSHSTTRRGWWDYSSHSRSALITSLSDEVIDKTVSEFADTPEGCTWLFELAGGAIADFEDTCVPKSQREASFTVAALHQWDMGINDPRCITTAESWISDTLKPVSTGGSFPSFLGRHESPQRTIACYGQNWDRMQEVKHKYDPTNVFRNSLWPLDDQGEFIEARTREPLSPEDVGTSFDVLKKGK
ncbi:hypothetical protein PQX77_012504 [Marasmius sp. AFHP31]|nr:hypothetical protein PQX77_012504 [Marasmius sp. AFHP31]